MYLCVRAFVLTCMTCIMVKYSSGIISLLSWFNAHWCHWTVILWYWKQWMELHYFLTSFMHSCIVSCMWLLASKVVLCHSCLSVYVKLFGFLKPKYLLYVYHSIYICIQIRLYLDPHETRLWLKCLSLQVYMMFGSRKCLIKLKMVGLARDEHASDGGWPRSSDLCTYFNL